MPKVTRKSSPLDAKIPEACSNEAAAVRFLEEQRGWTTDDKATCPRCGVFGESRRMQGKEGSRNARFLWRCGACKAQFTVKVGTIMEDSPIKAQHWCLAFYRAAASKKGISALQIQGETGLTYKSALFLMHRIRWAMAPVNDAESKLTGTVEFDETYIGGKPRDGKVKRIIDRKGNIKPGPGPDFDTRKTPVVGGVERDGRVKARVVAGVNAVELANHVRSMVDPSAHLMTDEAKAYVVVGREYASHKRVRHAIGEYVRKTEDGERITTNRIEGFWAGLKRQISGTHHSVSRKHLHRYVAEAEFKYNNRNLSDAERTVKLIQGCEQKRLTYTDQTLRRDSLGRRWPDRRCGPLPKS
jgi:transposase-like protein